MTDWQQQGWPRVGWKERREEEMVMIMTWGRKEGKSKGQRDGVQRNSTGPIMADEKLELQQMRAMLKYVSSE